MALLGSSATTSQSVFSALYLNQLIKDAINAQRAPITRLNTQKDQLTIKKAVYSDLKDKLSSLKNIVNDLINDGSTVFDNMKVVSSDMEVISATVKSSAVSGNYNIHVSNLAQSHTVGSDRQAESTEALNLAGEFTLNGVTIEVETDDSLEDIVETINRGDYEDEEEIQATIIDNRLVIKSVSTGTSHEIIAADTEGNVLESLGILDGGSFKTVIQDAEDAEFTVNGIEITRESNDDIDDVIEGVTLNLLSEDADSEIKVSLNQTDMQAKVSAFVYNFNDVMDYLNAKTKTFGNQGSETYVRGTLSGDTIFSRLKMGLAEAFRTRVDEGQADDPKSLSDVGLTLGKGLKLSLDDDTFYSALDSNLEGVVRVFDKAMERFADKLKPFTDTVSSSNVIDIHINSIDIKIGSITDRISKTEKAIKIKEEALIKQYSAIYMQNAQYAQDQYSALSIYSAFSTMV